MIQSPNCIISVSIRMNICFSILYPKLTKETEVDGHNISSDWLF